jgi:hypothetical protein
MAASGRGRGRVWLLVLFFLGECSVFVSRFKERVWIGRDGGLRWGGTGKPDK